MARKIFVNLPVKDLTKSVDFFSRLGFHFNPAFTDDRAACMVISDEAFVMLLPEAFYSTFTNKVVVDASTHNEAILAVSAGSRDEVDILVGKALAAGGQPSNPPIEDGPMYGASFSDIDGHLWEVISMEASELATTTNP